MNDSPEGGPVRLGMIGLTLQVQEAMGRDPYGGEASFQWWSCLARAGNQ
jgi:hypothetical protein